MRNEHRINTLWRNALLLILFGMTACSAPVDDKALGKGTLTVSPESKAVMLNDTFQYSASYRDSRNDIVDDVTVTWMSSDEAVATISAQGIVSGIGVGQADISASVTTDEAGTTLSNIARLTVTDNDTNVATVEITSSQSTFNVGESGQLTATAYNLNENVVADVLVSWSSSDSAIADIDANTGEVMFLGSGSARITASVDGISSAEFVVSIIDASETRIATFENAAHQINGTATLQANDSGGLELVFSDDFGVDDGPGLEVFLSLGPSPDKDSLNLGDLKSISGAQTYSIPSSVMIDDYAWVVVHCVPYDVVFGRGEF